MRGAMVISWGGPVRGREKMALDVFGKAVAFSDQKAKEGVIEDHEESVVIADPDGLLIELYAEMDQMLDEELGYFDPKPWHEFRPQRPRAWGAHDSPRNKWIPDAP